MKAFHAPSNRHGPASGGASRHRNACDASNGPHGPPVAPACAPTTDRKSTRLNSSHLVISYAVFCLKKKKSTYTAPLIMSCVHCVHADQVRHQLLLERLVCRSS